jgi:hypothetical protein
MHMKNINKILFYVYSANNECFNFSLKKPNSFKYGLFRCINENGLNQNLLNFKFPELRK